MHCYSDISCHRNGRFLPFGSNVQSTRGAPVQASRSGERVLHCAGDLPRETVDQCAVAPFHHHPQERLRTGRTKQHTATLAKGLLGMALRTGDAAVRAPVEARRHAHVDQPLGVEDEVGASIGKRHPALLERGEHLQLSGLHFVVLHTKGGAVRWFKVSRVEEASASD